MNRRRTPISWHEVDLGDALDDLVEQTRELASSDPQLRVLSELLRIVGLAVRGNRLTNDDFTRLRSELAACWQLYAEDA